MPSSAVSVSCETEQVDREVQGRILATIGGDQVGELTFVDYDGTTQITLVRVEADHQREGIATQMVAKLREELPGSLPAQFFLNAAGRALRDAIFDRYATPEVTG